MEVETTDTYEASYYILMGGIVKEVTFGKVQPNKRAKQGFKTVYRISLAVETRFVRYWREHLAVANVREFSNARKKLKNKIRKLQLEYTKWPKRYTKV